MNGGISNERERVINSTDIDRIVDHIFSIQTIRLFKYN